MWPGLDASRRVTRRLLEHAEARAFVRDTLARVVTASADGRAVRSARDYVQDMLYVVRSWCTDGGTWAYHSGNYAAVRDALQPGAPARAAIDRRAGARAGAALLDVVHGILVCIDMSAEIALLGRGLVAQTGPAPLTAAAARLQHGQ
jgi:hypothetical protein